MTQNNFKPSCLPHPLQQNSMSSWEDSQIAPDSLIQIYQLSSDYKPIFPYIVDIISDELQVEVKELTWDTN